jgi:tight adherence protein B
MRRALVGALVVAVVACGATAAWAQQPVPASLVPASSAKFPDRGFRLALPHRLGLGLGDVTVTENGDPVSRLTLASPTGGGVGQFGSILIIDASASMHGSAIGGAVAAARSLARERSPSQQLGIIAFNNTPRVLLAPTTDQHAIDAALRAPPVLAPQTHLFDAVGSAMDLLDHAGITAGSIVVLSDGSDTGSLLSGAAIAKRARASNVAIYTVGLRSRAFDSAQLKGLAAAGHGDYTAAASVGQLRRIFRDLGARLASDYLLAYRSAAQPGSRVTVAVRVRGLPGVSTLMYRVPGNANFVQVHDGFWTSIVGMIVTAAIVALLLGVGLGVLLVRRVRAPTVRERIAGFASVPGAELVLDTNVMLTDRATRSGMERSLEQTKWWAGFKDDLEIARITMAPLRIVALTALATLATTFVLVVATGFALIGILGLGVPLGVRSWVRINRDRQRAQFIEQLPDVLQGSASAIRAGHGLVAALSMVAEEAPEPSRTEFQRVVADEGLGVPLDQALRSVQMRMDSSEVLQLALVAQVQREAGGNMAEVLDRITEALRQRGELRRMVKALTAQGRLSRWVVTALPLILLLVISVLSPGYIKPLFTQPLGLFMLGLAAVMMTFGSIVIGKIVDFEV